MDEQQFARVVADTVRVFVIAGSLLLAVLVTKLTALRLRYSPDQRHTRVHWAVAASYVLLLVITAVQRILRIGEPPDLYLVCTTAAVALGLYGAHRRVDIPLRPPWARRKGR